MTHRINTVLPDILRRAQQRSRALAVIQAQWGRLVGRALAAHTKPVSLRRGGLVIHADRPGDSFALSYQRQQLLEQLRVTVKEAAIEELIIRPGDVRAKR